MHGPRNTFWAHSYDRELDDVFAIQMEIAEKTAAALRLELVGLDRESLRKKPTPNLAAYNLYLRGLHAARKSTFEAYGESVKFFEEAIEQDPEFSLAYSSLANMYVLLAGETIRPRDAFPRVQDLLVKALALDPASSEAHTARGNLALQHDRDWDLSESEFQRAIELNPSNANAHFWYAMLLLVLQRFDEAAEELRVTIELDPLWKLPSLWLMTVQFTSGDFDAAIVTAKEEVARDPSDPNSHVALGTIYYRAGRIEESRREAALANGPVSRPVMADRAVLWALLDMPDEARRLIREWTQEAETRYINPVLGRRPLRGARGKRAGVRLLGTRLPQGGNRVVLVLLPRMRLRRSAR